MPTGIKNKEFVYPVYRKQPLFRFGTFLTSLFNNNFWLASYSIDFSFNFWKYIDGLVTREEEEWELFMKHFEKMFENDTKLLDDVFSNCYYIGDEIIEESKRLRDLNFKDITSRHLLFVLHSFMEKWNYIGCFIIGLYPMESFLERKTKELLLEHIKKVEPTKIGESEKYLERLIEPIKKNFVSEEPIELLEIAAKIQQKGVLSKFPYKKRVINQELDKHFEKYCWLSTRHFSGKPWSKKEFTNRLKDLLKMDCKELLTKNRDSKEKREKEVYHLMNSLGIHQNKDLLKMIRLSQELIYFRTYRTDVTHIGAFNLRHLLNEIAKRFGYTPEEIVNMTVSEIINLPNKKVPTEILQQRVKGYGVFVINKKPVMIYGNELDKIKKEIDKESSLTNQEIKGQIAFKGKIKGKVRIVFDEKAMNEFQEGEILVTSTTTPNLMPAMKKASGFITDEGGITCHAAIVAREMKKPCIVGTGSATKILKDGNIIELDAEKSIINKIS